MELLGEYLVDRGPCQAVAVGVVAGEGNGASLGGAGQEAGPGCPGQVEHRKDCWKSSESKQKKMSVPNISWLSHLF